MNSRRHPTLHGDGDMTSSGSRSTCTYAIGAVAARLRASVVERSAGAASLHAVSGGGGHVALLVKANDKRLKVDVKASDQGLVDTVVAELKGLAV